jgi:hypothetical protein
MMVGRRKREKVDIGGVKTGEEREKEGKRSLVSGQEE